MEFITIHTPEDPAYIQALALYEQSFPAHAQRLPVHEAYAMGRPEYRYQIIRDGETFVGLITLWEHPDFLYIEKFAVDPALRGQGYGTRVLAALPDKPVILEIAPPKDSISKRRQAFYERAGFVLSHLPHTHPAYIPGRQPHELRLMSRPGPLTPELYRTFTAFLKETVMAGSPANDPTGKTLLHICCAPCSNQCIRTLREEGKEVTGFWYNPNIHPFTEYRSRRDGLRELQKLIALPVIEADEYGLRPFLSKVAADPDHRCITCYSMRLYRAAETAAKEGFDSFTTSLLISPYQNRELICQVGQAAGEQFGVTFLDRDFRPLFRAGQNYARAHGIYMQKYCGCIYSEQERYQKPDKIIR